MKRIIVEKDMYIGNIFVEAGRELFLQEGINDKHLFKAVFMAGGPGSGKSFVAGMAFSGQGAKFLNSDEIFEYFLDKSGLGKDIDPSKPFKYEAQMAYRNWAKALSKKQGGFWIDGMLPIIVDGTGKDYGKIVKQAEAMKAKGYDVSMIFVNTTLEEALSRNETRERSVPEDIVIGSWQQVQSNLGAFQDYFGQRDFLLVDNTEMLYGDDLKKREMMLFRYAKKFLERPLENPRGKKILEILRDTGGKYLSDLPHPDEILAR
jgi:predicted ABC-type ATPase